MGRLLGKLRRLVERKRETGIPIRRRGFATVIACNLADAGELSTPDLRRLVEWVGLGNLRIDVAQAIVADGFRRRDVAQARGWASTLGPREIGELVDLVTVERDELAFWQAHAIDETPAAGKARRAADRARAATRRKAEASEEDVQAADAAAAQKRAKNAARMRATRRNGGAKPREEYEGASLTKRAPWLHFGWSRRTWERKGKPGPVASPCAVASACMGGLIGGNRIAERETRSVLHPKPSRHDVRRSEGSPQAIPDAPRALLVVPSSVGPIADRSLRAIAARSTFSGAEVSA